MIWEAGFLEQQIMSHHNRERISHSLQCYSTSSHELCRRYAEYGLDSESGHKWLIFNKGSENNEPKAEIPCIIVCVLQHQAVHRIQTGFRQAAQRCSWSQSLILTCHTSKVTLDYTKRYCQNEDDKNRIRHSFRNQSTNSWHHLSRFHQLSVFLMLFL